LGVLLHGCGGDDDDNIVLVIRNLSDWTIERIDWKRTDGTAWQVLCGVVPTRQERKIRHVSEGFYDVRCYVCGPDGTVKEWPEAHLILVRVDTDYWEGDQETILPFGSPGADWAAADHPVVGSCGDFR
jgi:hypothetical protein